MHGTDELYALLKEINALKQEIQRLEKRVYAAIARRETEGQQDLTHAIASIINRLENEKGYAPIDTIVARAVKAGFDKDEVDAEIARLVG